MKLRHLYLFFFAVGTLLPISRVVPWLATHGLDMQAFFVELFSTQIGGLFGLDVMVSAVVLVIFTVYETRRLNMPGNWLYLTAVIVATFVAGVSSGFPLFLYLRQEHLDNL